jgi:hypothetical protein
MRYELIPDPFLAFKAVPWFRRFSDIYPAQAGFRSRASPCGNYDRRGDTVVRFSPQYFSCVSMIQPKICPYLLLHASPIRWANGRSRRIFKNRRAYCFRNRRAPNRKVLLLSFRLQAVNVHCISTLHIGYYVGSAAHMNSCFRFLRNQRLQVPSVLLSA